MGQCAKTCGTPGWYEYKGNCYSFGEDRLSFYSAEEHCRSNGATLLSVHSKDEVEFVEGLMENRRFYGRLWIGLNIFKGNRNYQWTDGSPVNYISLYPKKQFKIEKCFILYQKGTFRPEHCELRYRPICKKAADGSTPTNLPPIVPDPPKGNCPADWLQIGQKCFKFFGAKESERKTYFDAKQHCISMGEDHDLASVHSMEEQAFLTEKMGEFGTSVWIGLNRVESDEIGHALVYGWTDNSPVNFTHWAPGYPKSNTWQTCIRLSNEAVRKGYWVGDFCSAANFKYGYVCRRPPVSTLPPPPPKPFICGINSKEYRGDCYTFYSSPKTWNEAEKTCQSRGGNLVSVKDSFEEAFLYNFISRKATFFWNGLRTVDGTRIFHWSDNAPLYYSNWKNFVEVSPGSPHCVAANTFEELQWSTRDCNARLPFVCKRSNATYPVHDDITAACPTGESSYVDIGDGFCYHIGRSNNDRYQWGSASRYCFTKGMEMISVSSEHQTKLLMAYLWKYPYDFWLGLIRTFDKKSFMWVDKSPLSYTNWAPREPKTYSTGEDCVSFSTSDSKWSVEGCGQWRGSICRAKKIAN